MQVIPIIWPVLLCAFLTGMLFAWVWFVALPRIRRVEKKALLGSRGTLRNRRALSRPSESPIVDTDQPPTALERETASASRDDADDASSDELREDSVQSPAASSP